MKRLYHFTPPKNLSRIVQTGLRPACTIAHGAMSAWQPVIWLTDSPSNSVDVPALKHYARLGIDELLQEVVNGRRHIFGAAADGCARITLRVPKRVERAGVVTRYLPWMKAQMRARQYAKFRGRLSDHAENWFVCFAPIPVAAFEAVSPAGESTPVYLAAVKKIERRRKAKHRKGKA